MSFLPLGQAGAIFLLIPGLIGLVPLLAHLILPIIAAVKVSRGETYHYPRWHFFK